jgi:hypothetical protein
VGDKKKEMKENKKRKHQKIVLTPDNSFLPINVFHSDFNVKIFEELKVFLALIQCPHLRTHKLRVTTG